MVSLKKLFLLVITLVSLNMSAQTNANEKSKEVCEDNLVTTFTKYFGKTKAEYSKNQPVTIPVPSSSYNSTIDNIISIGKTFLGIPYRWGGVSEFGFDCSGFIKYIFEWFGIHLPRTSREMANYGESVRKDELQKGDLLFFTGRNSRSGVIGHIGIVVDVNDNEIKMMHSSSSRGVHIEDLNKSEYFQKRYITARRINVDESIYQTY